MGVGLKKFARLTLVVLLAVNVCMPPMSFADDGATIDGRDDSLAGQTGGASSSVEGASGSDDAASGEGEKGDTAQAGAEDSKLEGDDPVDISSDWEAGDACIDAPGQYVLSMPVRADAPLVVALPDGARATIDLAGFDVMVSGSATCAIDLSENAGEVAFVDSSYDARYPDKRASVTLKPEESVSSAAAIRAERALKTHDAEPKATFEHVAIAVDAAIQPSDWGEAVVSAVRSGLDRRDDDAWKGAEALACLSLSACAFEVAIESTDEENPSAGVDDMRGHASLIDAGCGGIVLDGRTSAKLQVNGVAAPADWPLLVSADDRSYSIGPDFSVAKPAAGEGEGSAEALAFGFPDDLLAPGSTEAVVAQPSEGKGISAGSAACLGASAGYDIVFDEATDGSSGFVQARMVRSSSSDLGSPGDNPDAADDRSATDAPTGVGSALNEGMSGEGSVGASAAKPSIYAEYVKAHQHELVFADQLKTATSGIDLNEAWKKQSGGLASPYTIKRGDTYYLSGDLVTEAGLVIDAPLEYVILNFNGHTLTMTGSSSDADGVSAQTMVSVVAAYSVELVGESDAGVSKLQSAGDGDLWAVSSTASSCTVHVTDLVVELTSDSPDMHSLHTHCFRMSAGKLEMSGCTVNMDMGNQAFRGSSVSSREVPSAVFASSGATSVKLTDCTVSGTGSTSFALSDVADMTSLGNVYAVYSLAKDTIVEGGSYKAVSLCGNATCLYGRSLKLEPGASEIALEADAGQLATGVLSASAGSVSLETPFSFSAGADYANAADVEAALQSRVANGFLFGACMPTESAAYPALVMTGSLDDANAPGLVIGSFSDELDASQRSAFAANALENALSDRNSCSIGTDALGLSALFQFDGTEGAVAQIGSTLFPSLSSALAAFSDGDELVLLRDVGAVSVSTAANGTLNLNTHSIASLEFSHAGNSGGVLVVRNGSISGVVSVGGSYAAIYHHSASGLSLDNVNVSASAVDVNSYGIYADRSAGKITLSSTTSIESTVSQTASAGAAAYGIFTVDGGSQLEVDGASVTARAVTAGAVAYGLYSLNSATVKNGATISAQGTTDTTCAVYVGGSLFASGSSFKAYTSGISDTACAIRASVSNPLATTISIDSCDVAAGSAVADVGNATYLCLMGADSETGTAAPSVAWVLSGDNSFESASGVHIGSNVGAVILDKGFSLNGASDSPLAISQSQRPENVGFSVAGGATAAQLDALAGFFAAKSGSYYEGWSLVANAGDQNLVWRPVGAIDGLGIVSVTHRGEMAPYGYYPSLADALARADSGDTVRLLGDLSEAGSQSVGSGDLAIDLGGHTLTLRAGNEAAVGDAGTGAAIRHSEGGRLAVSNGDLVVQVGASTEPVAGASYQGISVSGGGALSVDSSASVCVEYVGSTSTAAEQRDIALRGVSVIDGSLDLDGTLELDASSSSGLGAMVAYGVFAQPGAASEASVDIDPDARVDVSSDTGALTARNYSYAESSEGAASSGAPVCLREFTVDPDGDSVFYQDVLRKFRAVATYDDPENTSSRNPGLKSGIYYALDMVVDASSDDAWYDGLRVWAFSDKVASSDVGKLSSIVPTHIFVSTSYDTLPDVYGVATGADSLGKANVSVKGSVSVDCPHGNACALLANASAFSDVSWSCSGGRASLAAASDTQVHVTSQGPFDLRGYVDAFADEEARVVYGGVSSSLLGAFEAPVSRDVVVDANASLTLSGAVKFSASGLDAASVEQAEPFKVGAGFSLASGSDSCSVASSSGENTSGATFAEPVEGASISASLFEDAYGACAPGIDPDGNAVWATANDCIVVFKVGDAVVSRFAGSGSVSVDFSVPSARAARADDQRQTYRFLGWSTTSDENSTVVEYGNSGTATMSGNVVLYAVYETGFKTVPVRLANIRNGAGSLQEDVSFTATYGQTVRDALGADLPDLSDYVDLASGLTYRFVGWYPYSSAAQAGVVYSKEEAQNLEITLALAGMSLNDGLTMRATYVALKPGTQHLISFVVDGRTSVCVVDDGARPAYTLANKTNANYVIPAKVDKETGKAYTFNQWVDSAGDGYPGVLPRATADETYTADWNTAWADVTIKFHYYYYDEQSDTINKDGVRSFETTYEANVQSLADSVAKLGDDGAFSHGGKIYSLKGWSVRSTDAEAIYDAENPLPSASNEGSIMSTYSSNYYAVYSEDYHRVNVSFHDGSTELGSANVLAVGSTIGSAFASSGLTAPADKSASQMFLGWSTEDGASSALDSTGTQIQSIISGPQRSLDLFAVYGANPSYVVRLWDATGDNVLYAVTVKRGSSAKDVLVQTGVTVSVKKKTGTYFAGWFTAGGSYYDLATPVTGTTNLYATYKDVTVSTPDASAIAATVTVGPDVVTSLPSPGNVSGVTFSLSPVSIADRPVRSSMSSHSYTLLKSYDMELYALDSNGVPTTLSGSVCTATIKVYVGTAYRNAKVRAFWLGRKNGADAVLNSDEKAVDDKGYITLTLDNYVLGDATEGGNFAIGYIEGGTSNSSLNSNKSISASDLNSSLNAGLGVSNLSSAAGIASLASASGLALASSASASSGVASSNGSSGSAGLASGSNDADPDEGSAGEDAASGDEEEGSSMFEGWDSNGVVLVLLAIGAFAAFTRFLWWLLVGRQRRNEEEVELPDVSERYARGITF